ncbi:hypothetical protein [Microbacterium sp. 2MCAF23]|uniref:hypothetical protein n=1 Tax=Microbacterium sp. 2MCAF23 TaxID=3232985 RepID=UPI003F944C25
MTGRGPINPERAARIDGSHWVSPLNFEDEVTSQLDFPSPLGLIDSTLRKTAYTAGASCSIDGYLRIAAALDDAGVKDESLNLDWWGDPDPQPRELDLVREVLRGGFGFTVNVFADALLGWGDGAPGPDPRSVVDLLAEMGARVIAPGLVDAPDPAVESAQARDLENVVAYAQECGLDLTVTLANVGRRDFARMLRVVDHAVALGAVRVDLMDSTSSLSADAMRVFVRRFRAGLARPVPVTMHVHDDFGLGTAAAIAAAGAGAGPDVSVNSMSYRAGFAAMEEVVLALEVLYGVDTGIRVDRLQSLSELVSRESGVPLPGLKPVTGRYAHLKSTAIDAMLTLRDGPDVFPPVSGSVHPSVTGAEARWVWDGMSVRESARLLARALGTELDDAEVDAVKAALDAAAARRAAPTAWLEANEAADIARQIIDTLAGRTAPTTETAAGAPGLGRIPTTRRN